VQRLTEMTVDSDPLVRDLAVQRLGELRNAAAGAPEARIS
jgi:hypothetical protein